MKCYRLTYTLIISFNPVFSVVPACLGHYFIIRSSLNYKWVMEKLLQESVLSTFTIPQGIEEVSMLPLGTKKKKSCRSELWWWKSIHLKAIRKTRAEGWYTGKTQRDGMEREVGEGIGMGNTCKSMADSCQCMAKTKRIL